MVKVRIWGSLQKATDNKEFVEVEAQNFNHLLVLFLKMITP